MALVAAREPFDVFVGGTSLLVNVGDVFAADDPIVKGREHLFGEVTVRSSRPAPSARAAETASAEPGARRTITRSKGDKRDA